MVDTDSGERRAQKLEVQFERILGKFDSLPSQIELATMKAVEKHESNCSARKARPMSPKLLVGLISVITALIGVIGTMAAAG